MEPPTIRDIIAARKRIHPHLQPTPLHTYPLLNDLLQAEAHIKHENHNPTGAFKIRGGLNLIAQLTPDERTRGVITASTGNHGQSIALAAKIHNVKATICVPKDANPIKVASIRSYGATILQDGADYDEARLNAETTAKKHGLRYIHSANEPHLIAGVGTLPRRRHRPSRSRHMRLRHRHRIQGHKPQHTHHRRPDPGPPSRLQQLAQRQTRIHTPRQDHSRRPRHPPSLRTTSTDPPTTRRRLHPRHRARDQGRHQALRRERPHHRRRRRSSTPSRRHQTTPPTQRQEDRPNPHRRQHHRRRPTRRPQHTLTPPGERI